MLRTTTSQVRDRLTGRMWRTVATLARRADTHLVQEATRNAAVMIAAARTGRRLEYARTLQDLRRIGLVDDPRTARPEGTTADRSR